MRRLSEQLLNQHLSGLPIGPVYFFESIDSTNDEAARLLRTGEKHLAVIVADEQTRGKGRSGRHWYTPKGAAIAFSMVLDHNWLSGFPAGNIIPQLTGLGAIAVCDVLEQMFSLHPAIKWPNDVLVNGKKLAGVLVESGWRGNRLESVILGIGLNVYHTSTPPDLHISLQATCVEECIATRYLEGNSLHLPQINRLELIKEIITSILSWLEKLNGIEIRKRWEELLAYRGEFIKVEYPAPVQPVEGVISGLGVDCSLKICDLNGEEIFIYFGEVVGIRKL
jgi:BirA family biotin operon repressor/biotin-[acetyl-CoA-carboxylase] ligase